MSRPGPVVLDDLAAPRFTPEIDALRAGLADAAAGCPLEPAAIVAAAEEQTGVRAAAGGAGSAAFGERLDVLCTALREEAGLSPAGVVGAFGQVVNHVKNRLLLDDLLARHPEIHDQRIEAPIVICGLPRTGTTHLHNLVAADPALRSLPYWESVEPFTDDVDATKAKVQFGLDVMDRAMPHFKAMHEMTVDHVHEEIQLLALDLSTMLFETMAPMPTWRDYYVAHDQTPSYELLRTILKALQWKRGGHRWVLKSPQHLEQLPVLHAVFPDATYVVTHRDPVAVTASMATMVAYSARMSQDPVDPHRIGRYWSDAVERLLRACARDRDVLPPAQTINVRFHEFMADDLAMVERVYAVAGQPLDDAARTAMARFLATHPRGRHGRVAYDLAALGLDPAERRSALRFYTDRFAVPEE